MPIRITGMNSGLDTESIISELVKVQSTKKDNLVKSQTRLNWKMDAWKSLNSKIYGLYSGTISNMRFSSAYTQKKTTVSNPKVASVLASADAADGVQSLKVNSLARSGYLTGEVLLDDSGKKAGYTSATKLSELKGMGISEGDSLSFTIKTKGESKDIQLNGASTIGDVVKQLKDAGVNASFDEKNQRFFISATTTGTEADFSLTANDENGFKALSALGVNVLDDVTKAEYTRLSNMTADEKAAYIEAETTRLSDAALKSIADAEKTIEEKQKAFDEFFEKTEDAYFIKSEMDTPAKLAEQIERLSFYRDGIKEAPQGETEEEKTKREADLKQANERLASLEKLAGYQSDIGKAEVTKVDANARLANDSAKIREEVTASLDRKITMANDALSGAAGYSSGATRIKGQDATIELNGATFESDSNTFSINGYTITALMESSEEVSLTTTNDYDGIYDTIKKFIKGYNELINEMDKLYNADSSKGYDPLTSEEKKEMSDDEIEEWEKKIKDSILRRDSTLNGISNALQDAMNASISIDGKNYHLSDFGIGTLSYFTAPENQKHAYHIDGDKDDESTSGNADKLKNMIASEPETVMKFFQGLSANLYDSLTKKMSATSMSSIYKVYNDKQMQTEYDDFKKKITQQEERLKEFEDKWYSKFGAMETALAKLNSKTSAISGLLGGQ